MPGGYSTSIATTDAFIKTSHLMAKLTAAIKKRLHILISSVHKESTLGARKQHESTVRKLRGAARINSLIHLMRVQQGISKQEL